MEIDINIVIVIQHIAMHLMQRKAEDASLTLDPLWFQNAKRWDASRGGAVHCYTGAVQAH